MSESLPPLETKPRRLSLAEIVDKQIAALARSSNEHSSVKLTRNSRGDVQIEVNVRTGESGIETVDEASTKARQIYDHLAGIYPVAEITAKLT